MSNSGLGGSLTTTEAEIPSTTPPIQTQPTNAGPNRDMSLAPGTSTVEDPSKTCESLTSQHSILTIGR